MELTFLGALATSATVQTSGRETFMDADWSLAGV